ncbi:LacI family DNA-binding transcriptional regulator [Alkalihalobacillus sp. FSL R5-0424]
MTNIHDIAKMAGVSATTVSRVLNHHPHVNEETVRAVQKAIKETGYTKNIHAVHLKKGKTNLIGIVVPFMDQNYFSQLVDGIAKAVSKTDCHLLIIQTQYLEEKELEALELLKTKQVDCLIFCSRSVRLDVLQSYSRSGKMVLLEDVHEEGISCTYMNHYDSFYAALTFLYEHGHKRIGICLSRENSTSSLQRKKAFADFMEAHQLSLLEQDIVTDCLYLEDGITLANRLLQLDGRPTAFLVTNDQVAAGIYTTCVRAGLRIPEDLAIIGFDNQSISKALDMTTVQIPFNKIGEQLVKQALEPNVTRYEMKLELIKRGTV